jgi:hypothetical protein
LSDQFPADPRNRHELAVAARILAVHREETSHPDQAEPLYRLAVRLHSKLADDFPSVPQGR